MSTQIIELASYGATQELAFNLGILKWFTSPAICLSQFTFFEYNGHGAPVLDEVIGVLLTNDFH